jgi:hypothetical protein
MKRTKNLIIVLGIIGLFTSCKKNDEIENHAENYLEVNSTYFVQFYVRKGAELARVDRDRKFGDLTEFSETNDSSAYVYAFKLAETMRGESQNMFSDINGFKLYNSQMDDITNSITFEGIEMYPNPFK